MEILLIGTMLGQVLSGYRGCEVGVKSDGPHLPQVGFPWKTAALTTQSVAPFPFFTSGDFGPNSMLCRATQVL